MRFVKICGLRTREALAAAREADAVGFVVESPRSRRNLALAEARALATDARAGQLAVAVTAAKDARTLLRIAEAGFLAVQAPADADLAALRKEHPRVRILAAARPGEAIPVEADILVLDATREDGYGGTGARLDPDASRRAVADARVPALLAGGLAPENVAEAIRRVAPFGVDVSSGVETDGHKDPEKIVAFIRNARSA